MLGVHTLVLAGEINVLGVGPNSGVRVADQHYLTVPLTPCSWSEIKPENIQSMPRAYYLKGDVVEVNAPGGLKSYEIIDVKWL